MGKKFDWTGRHKWEIYSTILDIELRQCMDEGKNIAYLEELIKGISNLPTDEFKEKLAYILYQRLESMPIDTNFSYNEPSDLTGIKAARKQSDFVLPNLPDSEVLRSRIAGAWIGRISGCLLGKPLEGYRTPNIKKILKKTDNYPLKKYISSDLELQELLGENHRNYSEKCWIDTIEGYAPWDDDTNYTVMTAKCIIEKYGRDFTPYDVARTWIDCQTKQSYCTAERVAYINIINGMNPPYSAIHKNPYREWIGAQIRGDYFGYINPGRPDLAAEMAWRDASISHIKNGIYGEMLIAAMLAAASVSDNMEIVLEAGLQEIPANSRLYEQIKKVMQWYKSGVTAADCFAKIHKIYDENDDYDWCHTIPNALIVISSLLYGENDFGKSICMSVENGFDTDCNGATVGSIVGMMIGKEAIPYEWIAPFDNTLETTIMNLGLVKVDELVDLTIKHINS